MEPLTFSPLGLKFPQEHMSFQEPDEVIHGCSHSTPARRRCTASICGLIPADSGNACFCYFNLILWHLGCN